MRIAFLSFDFGEYCVRLASAIAHHAELRLLIAEAESRPYRYLLHDSVDVFWFDKPRLRQGFRQVKLIWRLLRRIHRFRPDVVHLQAGHMWFNLALPFLRRYPLVLTVHDATRHPGDQGAANTPQWILDYGISRADQLLVHADSLKQQLMHQLGIPGNRIHVVPMVLQGDDEVMEHVEEEEKIVLFFGRIWPYKGLDHLIRAEPLITAQVPDVKIVIAGQGEDMERYRQMMVHPDRFIVHNHHIPDDMRAALFRQASVVVLPYIEASQSGVIPVAYRYGKPVVATTVGGLPELVEDGASGYLVPPRDEQALAQAVIQLLKNPALRRQFGRRGQEKVNSECAVDNIARLTMAVYCQALGSMASPGNPVNVVVGRD